MSEVCEAELLNFDISWVCGHEDPFLDTQVCCCQSLGSSWWILDGEECDMHLKSGSTSADNSDISHHETEVRKS